MGNLRLIFNADDFGRARSINSAVIHAHEHGVLTSASLMVAEAAAEDAVEQALAHPTLAVGLHLVTLDGRPALSPAQIPRLVNRGGRLPGDPFLLGVRVFFSPAMREELRRELVAQFERFRETGLPLAHVDGHCLMHLHPTLFDVLLPLVEHYGAAGIRLPRDDLRLALALDSSRAATKVGWAAVFGLLCRLAERRLRRSPLCYTDRVYGLLQTGRMHEGVVARLVRRIPPWVRTAEIYLHPSTESLGEPLGPNPGDWAALLSPQVRQAIRQRGAELTTYAALAAEKRGRVPCHGQPCS